MKNVIITITNLKTVMWRVKLCIVIMRFAVWVGGFGGISFKHGAYGFEHRNDENGIVEHIRTETKSPVCEDCGGELRESPSGIKYCRIHGIQCKAFNPNKRGKIQ